MSLLCKIVGHKLPLGWHRKEVGYGKVTEFCEDGIGHKHGLVSARCERCDEWFPVVMIHLPCEPDITD